MYRVQLLDYELKEGVVREDVLVSCQACGTLWRGGESFFEARLRGVEEIFYATLRGGEVLFQSPRQILRNGLGSSTC